MCVYKNKMSPVLSLDLSLFSVRSLRDLRTAAAIDAETAGDPIE